MKKTIFWIALVLSLILTLSFVACGTGGLESTGTEKVGSAPDFTVSDMQGNTVNLSDFVGKPVVINFWATWCGPCVREMPDFNKAYAENPDVVFLMVNVTDGVYDTVDKATNYVREQGFAFDIYFDIAGQAVKAYDVSAYPTTVFINAEGDVVSKKTGMISYEKLIKGIELITE